MWLPVECEADVEPDTKTELSSDDEQCVLRRICVCFFRVRLKLACDRFGARKLKFPRYDSIVKFSKPHAVNRYGQCRHTFGRQVVCRDAQEPCEFFDEFILCMRGVSVLRRTFPCIN